MKTPEILFEDNHLMVVNKPAGMLVQGDKTGDEPLLEVFKKFIKVRDNKPGNVYLGLVHRIDRPVSGVVVFAKTSKALTRMNKIFAERAVQKTYVAIVQKGKFPSQKELVHHLLKNPKQNKSYPKPPQTKESKLAKLSYKVIQSLDNFSVLEVLPHTGRHHQIRAQLADAVAPIKGDLKYGAKRSNPDGSICLHARMLEFEHPIKKEPVKIIAPYPRKLPVWKAVKG